MVVMTASSWLSLLAICVLGAVSPGPSLVAVVKSTVHGSRLHGLVTASCHALGIGIYALLVAAGIGLVITETPWLYTCIKYAGSCYLAWMGLKASRASSWLVQGNLSQQPHLSLKQAALDGFMLSFLNPKVAVFFLALFSQFVTPQSSAMIQIEMALMVMFCDALWFCLVASVAGHEKVLPALQKRATLINRLCGTLLILVAMRIVFL